MLRSDASNNPDKKQPTEETLELLVHKFLLIGAKKEEVLYNLLPPESEKKSKIDEYREKYGAAYTYFPDYYYSPHLEFDHPTKRQFKFKVNQILGQEKYCDNPYYQFCNGVNTLVVLIDMQDRESFTKYYVNSWLELFKEGKSWGKIEKDLKILVIGIGGNDTSEIKKEDLEIYLSDRQLEGTIEYVASIDELSMEYFKNIAKENIMEKYVSLFDKEKINALSSEKTKLVTKYFMAQRKAYLNEEKMKNCATSTVYPEFKKLQKLENDIMHNVKAEEIHGLINVAFDLLYANKVNKDEGLHFQQKANELIILKTNQEFQSTKSKAFWYTVLCCIPIITIPFAPLINNAFLKLFAKKQHLQIVTFDLGTHNWYFSMKKSKVLNQSKAAASEKSTLTKADLFNKSGEVRKFFMSAGSFFGPFTSEWRATTAQANRLVERIKIHALKENSRENIQETINHFRP